MPEDIREVLRKHTDEIMEVPGVVGIAEGRYRGKPCVMVFVVQRTPEMLDRLPASLDGNPVQVEESGEFRALDS